MGSGKSTLGKALASHYNIPFIDLDEYIVQMEQMSIPELFESKGALYFRKAETRALHLLSEQSSDFVLSTGGGTPCYGTNMDIILATTPWVFYLKLTVPTLAKRLAHTQATRPLIADLKNEELSEFIGKHLFERSFYYNKSHYIINTDQQREEETRSALIDLIH